MAFRFSLATVLRYRESLEKREEVALQKVLLEMARIRREVTHLEAEIASAQEARSKALLHPIAAAEVQMMLRSVEAMEDRKKALIASLHALEPTRLTQMKKYQAAHRDRQMLSDMCARQLDAYEQERTRAQQKFLDDIFAARAQRS